MQWAASITLGEAFPGIFFAIVAIVVAAIGYFSWQAEKKRREAMLAWAHAGGWEYDPGKRRGQFSYNLDICKRGHSRYSRYSARRSFESTIPGLEHDTVVELCEYHYAVTRNSGKNSSTQHYYFTCGRLTPGIDLGHLVIRDEHWGDRFAGAIGFDDIDFEDPDFSKRFHVSAASRQDAYDLIDHNVMRYLRAHPGWTIEAYGPTLYVWQRGKVTPERYDAKVRFVLGLLAQVPRVMVNRERARRGLPPVLEAGGSSSESRRGRTAG
ncbi:MAG: hypothetical protein AAGD00_04380 [Planctomycetota bacterium]